MTPEQGYSVISLLNDIKKLLEKQNQLLENQQATTGTKITVVGTSGTTSTKGLKSDEDFSL
ncbi:hypothetical protein UFOVP449_214 [uncultured Caudovirales phage]|uniref:Uncharacterized protein n=1 Tax=uncultured Caudovirales phage TaxID=2100421 RepID=A0A6J5MEL0_9CAUD|nr:hypothetical protein UFOVP449_214 [uncultured Caudovirales phage]